jgi:hypothetical protein
MTDPISRPIPVFKKTGTFGIRVASEAKEDHRTMAPRAASLLFTCKGYCQFRLKTQRFMALSPRIVTEKQPNPEKRLSLRRSLREQAKALEICPYFEGET